MRLLRIKSGRDGTLLFLPTTYRERHMLHEVMGSSEYRFKVRSAQAEGGDLPLGEPGPAVVAEYYLAPKPTAAEPEPEDSSNGPVAEDAGPRRKKGGAA